MEASSAIEAIIQSVKSQVMIKDHTVPARPPLCNDWSLDKSAPSQVDCRMQINPTMEMKRNSLCPVLLVFYSGSLEECSVTYSQDLFLAHSRHISGVGISALLDLRHRAIL